jgi:hypothetical protein
LLILFCFFTSNFNTVADLVPDPTNLSVWIDAVCNVTIVNGTTFDVNVTMDVHKIEAFNKICSADYIRNLKYAGEDEYKYYETIGAIKNELRKSLHNGENQQGILDNVFEKANIVSVIEMPAVKTSNIPSDDDPWNPPITFYDVYKISLTNDFLNLSEEVNSNDLVNGLLNAGGKISYKINLKAKGGWNLTYAFVPSFPLKIVDYDGYKIGNRTEWKLFNWNNAEDINLDAELSIEVSDVEKPNKEDIFVKFEIDTRNVDSTSLDVKISTKSVDMRKYDSLPDFVSNITFLKADGIRLLIANKFLSWDVFLNKSVKPVEENITKGLSTILNQYFDFVCRLDDETSFNCSNPYNISKMDDKPSINFTMHDNNIDFYLCGFKPKVLFGLLNAGGIGRVSPNEINFYNIQYPYEGLLYLPKNITLDNKSTYKWNSTKSLSGEIKSTIGRRYTNENKCVDVLVDIKSADLNWVSAFGGKSILNMNSDILYVLKSYVIKKPDNLSLKSVTLDYLCSDALRLLIEEKIFSGKVLNDFLSSIKRNAEENMAKIFNKTIEAKMDKILFYNSLKWDGDIYDMDDDLPVNISVYSKFVKPVFINLGFIPPSLSISNISFNLVGSSDYNISYKIIFPKGISIETNDPSISKSKTKDGREFVVVSFEKGESLSGYTLNCSLKASPLFVIFVLQPCWIIFGVIILIIIILALLRKRRKGKKIYPVRPTPRKMKEIEEEEEGFYIPPEPPREGP